MAFGVLGHSRLRRGMYLSKLKEKLKVIVELDEFYMTAGSKEKHGLQRPPRVRGLRMRDRGTYKTDKPSIMVWWREVEQ